MIQERRCVSCRRVGPKTSFWRIVRIHPSGQIQLDTGMGRSAYICPSDDCLRQAQRKNRLGRALKVSVDEALFGELRQRFERVQMLPQVENAELSGGPEDDKRQDAKQSENL